MALLSALHFLYPTTENAGAERGFYEAIKGLEAGSGRDLSRVRTVGAERYSVGRFIVRDIQMEYGCVLFFVWCRIAFERHRILYYGKILALSEVRLQVAWP